MCELTQRPFVDLYRRMQRDAVLRQALTAIAVKSLDGAEAVRNSSAMGAQCRHRPYQQFAVRRNIVHQQNTATCGNHSFNRVTEPDCGHQCAHYDYGKTHPSGHFGRKEYVPLLGNRNMGRPFMEAGRVDVISDQLRDVTSVFWMGARREQVEKDRDVELIERTNHDTARVTHEDEPCEYLESGVGALPAPASAQQTQRGLRIHRTG
jgi:hypothetical protein